MSMTRRSFVAAAGGALASMAALGSGAAGPNSRVGRVQIGAITYSFRQMPDQSAEALLRYCLECGISAIELMGTPAESYAGLAPDPMMQRVMQAMRTGGPLPAGMSPPGTAPSPLTPQQEQERQELLAAQTAYQRQAAAWRASAPMDKFVALRQLYNAAGVSIYAFKPSVFESSNSAAEVDYGLRAAKALGANHVTVELPSDTALAKRLGDAAAGHGLRMAYHAHTQATPTAWDAALAASPGNAINLDLGHFVAAGDYDGLAFIRKHHQRIASMHMKDRQTKAHGGANRPWGEGDAPLAQALRLMRDQRYAFPATVELEYEIPAGSDAVKEVARCVAFCRKALATPG